MTTVTATATPTFGARYRADNVQQLSSRALLTNRKLFTPHKDVAWPGRPGTERDRRAERRHAQPFGIAFQIA